MNKKLPYEEALEQQLNDLPLPPQDPSWHAMKRMLDKDQKPRSIVFFKKYGGLVLLGIALITGCWYILGKNAAVNKKFETKTEKTIQSPQENSAQQTLPETKNTQPAISPADNNSTTVATHQLPEENKVADSSADATVTGDEKSGTKKVHSGVIKSRTENSMNQLSKASIKIKVNKKHFLSTTAPFNNKLTQKIRKTEPLAKAEAVAVASIFHKKEKSSKARKRHTLTTAAAESGNATQEIGKTASHLNNTIKNADTTERINKQQEIMPVKEIANAEKKLLLKDSVTNKMITKNTDNKSVAQVRKNSKAWLWSAGAGVQQPIPVGGQTISNYGRNGTKNIIGDYIPSVYLRVEKTGKWFLQSEFSYAAPQPVKEFAYNRKTKPDNGFVNITTTTLRLKKAYYHNIPLSFNYYLLPHWTIGAGGMYSLLHRAVSEQQTTVKNTLTQQEILNTYRVIPSPFTDSFLYRSQWHWLLQTDYHWRRFSFGLRYTRDLEPFIKYLQPNGEVFEKKNWLLDFFIRFRLWQSGK